MAAAQSETLVYLLFFIGFLMTVIFSVVLISGLKKSKLPPQALETQKNIQPPAKTIRETIEEQRHQPPPEILPEPVPFTVPEVETNLRQALKKTEESFFGRIRKAFSNEDKKMVLEQIEEVLYTSDLGPTTVQKLLDVVENELSSKEASNIDTVKKAL
ncbi:MAG: signal recognition particle receptor subunit alpha, partial [Bdellovibrionaceae bacterium]|nr:signal recognition particle receptor subunit alpha [Bdellovibrio sp.]